MEGLESSVNLLFDLTCATVTKGQSINYMYNLLLTGTFETIDRTMSHFCS